MQRLFILSVLFVVGLGAFGLNLDRADAAPPPAQICVDGPHNHVTETPVGTIDLVQIGGNWFHQDEFVRQTVTKTRIYKIRSRSCGYNSGVTVHMINQVHVTHVVRLTPASPPVVVVDPPCLADGTCATQPCDPGTEPCNQNTPDPGPCTPSPPAASTRGGAGDQPPPAC
jgi:hypothetical protein